jgi:cell wall assembly regulator SMI1
MRRRKAKTAKASSKARKRAGIVGSIPPSAIAATWARIERVLAAKKIDLRLRPPASQAQIKAAERELGVAFPDDMRASLRVHDGQEDDAQVQWLPVAQRLGSLESLVACWKGDRAYYDAAAMKERMDWLDETERVRQVHLDPRQIPIAGSAFWDYDRLLIDFVPGPAGTQGQIIARSDIDLVFIAESFGALLADIATRLESGALELGEDGA